MKLHAEQNNIKVSIIMPSLNVVNYIDECIKSAINQTLREIEIICVDAGSNDGTCEKLQLYANMASVPVHVIHSKIKSYGYQVNQGIRIARGEYIAILETDDFISTEMYKTLYEIAENTKADIIKADYDSFYSREDGSRVYTSVHLWNEEINFYNQLINPQDMVYLYAEDRNIWKGIYRREFLLENDIWLNESPGAAFQDIGFAQQALACAKKAYYIKDSFYRYRVDRDDSSIHSVHGLEYAYNEFRRLVEDRQIYDKLHCKTGLYLHMLMSFCIEFQKTIRSVDYDCDSEYVRIYFEWFTKQINASIHRGDITQGDILRYSSLWDSISGNVRQYSQELEKRDLIVHNNHKNILSCVNDKKVVVFGAGQYGQWAIDFLQRNSKEIVALYDNSEQLWNTEKYGFTVQAPCHMVCDEMKNYVYIIANKSYTEEIKSQFLNMGIPEESIFAICF